MSTVPLVDTSVAVALLVSSHAEHRVTNSALASRRLGLTAHSAVETYSVLTRLPGDARLAPADAAELLRRNFIEVLSLPTDRAARFPSELAALGIAGGAAYDGLIAATAAAHGRNLLTRDRRAAATYAALGATVEFVG